MISASFLESAVGNLYVFLTAAKILHFALFVFEQRSKSRENANTIKRDIYGQKKKNDDEDNTNDNDDDKDKKKMARVEYTPGVQVVFHYVSLFLAEPQELTKIPRKVFREVTDPWLDQYNAHMKQRPPKRFTSMAAAKHNFVVEFTQDPWAGFYGDIQVAGVATFIKLPSGLVSSLALIQTFLARPIFMIREKFFLPNGSAKALFLKATAAMTVAEVYVVCCKENIYFETALHKYPWVAGVLSHQPMHPMIGRSVCPLYQRTFDFPKDVMDFEYEMLLPDNFGKGNNSNNDNSNSNNHHHNLGLMVMFQKRSSWILSYLAQEWLLPCNWMSVGVVITILQAHGWTVPPHLLYKFFIFYSIRLVADYLIGTRYHLRYQFYP